MWRKSNLLLTIGFALALAGGAHAQKPQPDEAMGSPDERARQTEAQMTDDERFGLIHSLMIIVFTTGKRDERVPADVPQIAGWVKGVPRLGVPNLLLTDAGLGITNPGGGRKGDAATAFPSAQLQGATFNPALSREGGRILAREARARGFNVVLGGGMNLARDPRHGRNFEYFSEDPLLSALMASEQVMGIQGENVMGMLKHVSLNSHETNKWELDAQIDPAAHRESELLGFQIGIERSDPGSLMCAYNKINGAYACGNDPVLNGAIKKAIGFKGFVMSDWKAVYNWDFALKGLDQHSGVQLDKEEWFVGPLRQAYQEGKFPKERLSDMARRILRSIYASGIDKWSRPGPAPDMQVHHEAVLETARQGIVLLKNEGGLLPLAGKRRIALIGGYAHVGAVGGGGGSSQTIPPKGYALVVPLGGEGLLGGLRKDVYIVPSPMAELQKLLPDATVTYDSGEYPAQAAALARRSDVAIVVANKLESEGFDSPDLSLPHGQDALINAVAAANPNTVVVLQTGNPVSMPWRAKVKAIVQAWYAGQAGGQPMAEVLAGRVNPSGRLPVTFYASIGQTPHPKLAGFGTAQNTPTTLKYHEGAEIGYRWLAKTGQKPNFTFGHGLTYTSFAYKNLKVSGGETVTATFTVTNTGKRAGADVPQVYLTGVGETKRMRLLGFERVELQPGESKTVTLAADPRLLARFDAKAGQWRIAAGTYKIALGKSAGDPVLTAETRLKPRMFGS
jgi:beta-glucosidase